MATDPLSTPTINWLPRLASAGAALLGIFLLLGAWGHLQAVTDAVFGSGADSTANRLALLLPFAVLAVTGLTNLAIFNPLWNGTTLALHLALASNGLALAYLLYLLVIGIPGHPVGLFTALVVSEWLVLVAVRLGLVWPCPAPRKVQP